MIEYFHGAVCEVGVSDTAVPHRDPGYNLGIFSEWTDPTTTDENIAWARETYAAMKPYRAQLRYVNYLDEDDVGEAVRAAYGPNYDRLVKPSGATTRKRLPSESQHRSSPALNQLRR